ncbi:MAG TPA: TolC family protein [Tepidisphaeraceae bacterium]
MATALWGCGSDAGHPSPEQIKEVNQLVRDRTAIRWDVGRLVDETADHVAPAPIGDLTLQEATERALAHNLSLIAAGENLSVAHTQLAQVGLITNPTVGQSSGWLFPFASHASPAFDVNITMMLNSIFTQPARVSIAQLQELQANIDMASQAYLLAQQVDGKYQEMIQLSRRRRLAERITELYARAVRAAEARRKVGIITTPELNRARLSYQDSVRQVRHLTTQYARAAREMNWLMGYATEPQWRLPQPVIEDVGTVPVAPDMNRLGQLARQFRLDLLRADFDRKLGERGIAMAKLGMIPQITVGGEFARDNQKMWSGGPILIGVTLPIFDPGLVALALAEAQNRKAQKSYAALDGQVGQDVRTAFDNWRIAADDVNFFRESLIPQQEENVRLMETSFRFGNDDLDTLLNVYQNYVSQLQSFEDAIQAYHDSGVALQQAVGLTWDRILAESGVRGAVTQPATTRAASEPATVPASGAASVPTTSGVSDVPRLIPLTTTSPAATGPTTRPAGTEPQP